MTMTIKQTYKRNEAILGWIPYCVRAATVHWCVRSKYSLINLFFVVAVAFFFFSRWVWAIKEKYWHGHFHNLCFTKQFSSSFSHLLKTSFQIEISSFGCLIEMRINSLCTEHLSYERTGSMNQDARPQGAQTLADDPCCALQWACSSVIHGRKCLIFSFLDQSASIDEKVPACALCAYCVHLSLVKSCVSEFVCFASYAFCCMWI